MKKTFQATDNLLKKVRFAINGVVLFQSGSFAESALEKEAFNHVMRGIEAIFSQSVFVGTVGLWDGTRDGYRFCSDFKDLREVLSNYDDIIIRQIGTRLYFTLIHHDGRHEMELRRWNDGEWVNPHAFCLGEFDDMTLRFIKHSTENFGKIATLRK